MSIDQHETTGAPEQDAPGPLTAPPVVLRADEVPPARGMARVRLRTLYRIGGLLLGLLVLISALQAGVALHGSDAARRELIEHVDPAALGQYQLSTAVGRQDSAVRGYATSGGGGLLDDYRRAIADEAAAEATMRRRLAGVHGAGPTLQRLEEVRRASAAWRAGFADPIASGAADKGVSNSAETNAHDLFVKFRAAVAALQAELTALHGKVAGHLKERATITTWSVGIALATVLLAALLLALLISRTVLRPVSSLTANVRAVSQGDFTHPLDISGPEEIAELAVIIDAMRHRILDEWRVSSEARALLDEQTAELRRSNAELEQFAYVASHDLQEPLRKVASFCQMIERRYGDQLDERGRQYIQFAVDGAKRMQSLINDLLSFSRVGRMTSPEPAVDLGAVAERAVDNLSALREETGAEVTVGDLPTLPGDRTQLGQLFQNLVGNAIKFRRPGVPPEVRVTAELRDDGMWEFACADNGIGIEPRYADRIFLIFQRLHPREEYTGTGIGLALCKKIVEYHGGEIWLGEGDPDRPGTTIRWTMPAGAKETNDDE
ncbi:sensor histidine kinase [Actinomadura macrotermitis]|uniref:histidine kinase n=1 Tax=Actinomadura macrotermitis TaxID=2585200 RepID=A0A7K0BUL8_9ACTN|nr:ATP-binding protein [Actinomadura macrotermitis]MQY04888.1 Adaptive-response sensory-kinase SasA [Actinomadura macrotermitis]